MADEVQDNGTVEQEAAQTPTSAGTEKPDTSGASDGPAPVPYERFKSVNEELKTMRKRMEEFEKADKKRREAEMSEAERLTAELGERSQALERAEARAFDLQKRFAFTDQLAAQQLTLLDPRAAKAAMGLLDDGMVTLDDGELKGMDKAVKLLVKDHPYLFKQPEKPNIDGDAGRGPGKPPQSAPNDQELRQRYRIQ